MKDRIQIEDALKHLYKGEASKRTATIDSLAGALSLERNRVVELLNELRAARLLEWEDDRFLLTPSGKDYALQVIRAHRLYEHYLAEQTGVSEDRWHALAEKEEHRISGEDLDAMDSLLGYPRFDPHGDPIPTSDGEMPELESRPLLACPVGWHGRIVHIEDEPEGVYQEIIAHGLAAGMPITVLDWRGDTILLNAVGLNISIDRSLATNIGVEAHPVEAEPDASIKRLSQLTGGDAASVIGLTPACRGPERNRLLDLGVVPGTTVKIALTSPSGNPTAYRIRGASIALRKDQAEKIMIRKQPTPPEH